MYFLTDVFMQCLKTSKTFTLLLNMKVHLLQKLRLNIIKTSSQTELKGLIDNLVLLNGIFQHLQRERNCVVYNGLLLGICRGKG